MKRKRVTSAFISLGLLAAGGGAGWWAASTLLEPPEDVLAAPAHALATAREGTVGQSLRLNAAGQWATTATFQGFGSGVITERVLVDGDAVGQGDVLFTLNLRPVVIAEGMIPAFRDLTLNARGDDVTQLQELLIALGYFTGEPSGVFGAGTRNAVREWQRGLGLERTGVVGRGDILFIPELPARLALTGNITVGAELAGTWNAVQVLDGTPSFAVSLTDQQMMMVAPGLAVEVQGPNAAWPAIIDHLAPASQEGYQFLSQRAVLTAPDGGPVCADECHLVSVGDPTLFGAFIHVVPEVTGVVVPAAAVVTDAAGRTGVRLADGEFHPVELLASATGSAVVVGIEVGMQVRTPGDGR